MKCVKCVNLVNSQFGWVGSGPAGSLRSASDCSGSLREPSEPTRQSGFRRIWRGTGETKPGARVNHGEVKVPRPTLVTPLAVPISGYFTTSAGAGTKLLRYAMGKFPEFHLVGIRAVVAV